MFIVGFDGTSVTPQIKELIEKHHVGNLLLTAKNLKCETFVFESIIADCIVPWSILTRFSGRGHHEALL
jgi:hypothetical protein